MEKDYISNINLNAERRFLSINTKPIEFRDSAEEGEEGKAFIKGYAAVYESETMIYDGCMEKISKGAADDCLNDDVRCLFNHNPNYILGRSTAGTLKFGSDDTGIWYENELDLSIDSHSSLYKSMKRGDITQSSFAFVVKEQTWTDTKNDDGSYTYLRTITKFEMIYDVSPVTYPAYADTTVAARSVNSLIEEAKKAQQDNDEQRKADDMAIVRNIQRKLKFNQ